MRNDASPVDARRHSNRCHRRQTLDHIRNVQLQAERPQAAVQPGRTDLVSIRTGADALVTEEGERFAQSVEQGGADCVVVAELYRSMDNFAVLDTIQRTISN